MKQYGVGTPKIMEVVDTHDSDQIIEVDLRDFKTI